MTIDKTTRILALDATGKLIYPTVGDVGTVIVPPAPIPPTPAPVPGPTNTGPRVPITGTITLSQWISATTASAKLITGDDGGAVNDQTGRLVGKRLTATDCVINGLNYIEPDVIPDINVPQLTLNYCRLTGGISQHGPVLLTANGVNFDGQSYVGAGRPWTTGFMDHEASQTPRKFPWTVTNSWFHAYLPAPPPAEAHCEALHMVGACDGPRFTNVRYSQDGNTTGNVFTNVTGIVKITALNGVWDGCVFDWNGTGPPSYFSLYMEGRGNVVKNTKALPGTLAYFFNEQYPNPGTGVGSPLGGGPSNNYTMPTCTGCTDLVTGKPFAAGS